jgi:ATP-dependent protease ClpP protease subunit
VKNVRPIKARISAQAGVTRVDVYDDIGEGGWFSEGLTAKSFANQLAGLSGPLEVHINSGGGDVWDGISIKNAIETHNGSVTTIVDGIAASIASVIAQAGTERVMMPGSMLMIHEAFTYAAGNSAELAKTAATLDEVSANLAAIYARAAGGTAEDWRAAMKEETWYTADQAVDAGLADRVGDGQAALPVGFDVAAFADVPGRIAAQLRTLPQASAPAEPEAPRLTISVEGALDEALVERLRAAVRTPEAAVEELAPGAGESGDDAAQEPTAPDGGNADEGGTSNHAEDLPGWIHHDAPPLPAWLNPAEEAMK